MKKSKLLFALTALLTALLVVSGAVAVPLLVRPFYYAHVPLMGLAEYTGLSAEQIRQAYDQVMDFCLGLRPDFSAGVLGWSPSGAAHFADVRALFILDLWVLAASLGALAILLLVRRITRIEPCRVLGRGAGFWAAAGVSGTFLVVGGLAALDFSRAFVVFHTLFFPGKENWIFDWRDDPVILILPEGFFRNCAILVLALVLLACLGLIVADFGSRAGKRR